MNRTLPLRCSIVFSALFLAACGGESPTEPAPPGLTGRWTGALSLRGGLDAGQTVTLELVDSDGHVIGTMADWDGTTWSVDGDERLLAATRLPATSVCSTLTLGVEHVEFREGRPVELSGSVTGRCYGTADGSFRLARN
jgi:hypothetical protein